MREFIDALRAIDPPRVRRVLEADPEVRASIDAPVLDFGSPPIVWAASTLNEELIETLVEFGADIDARSAWENGPYSALHHAAAGAGPVRPRLAEKLLALGATLDLHSAAGLGRLDELAAMLDEAPERIAEPGPDGATPLHMAGTPEVAAFLLDRGAPIDQPCIDHLSTPAMWAVDGRRDVTRYLVDRGCRTDLWMAAALGDVELARRILAADPSAITVEPGDDALGGGNIYIWRLQFATSPLEVARRDGFDDVYTVLREAAPPELLLLEAALYDRVEEVRALLAETPASSLPAHRVRQLLCRGPAVAGAVLDAGGDPDALNRNAQTALHDAAWRDDVDLIDLLLDRGADPRIRDGMHHSTPWGWADYNESTAAAARLVEREAYDEHDAIAMGRIDEVLAWVRAHPDQVGGSADGSVSPLRTAAWCGHEEIVRALLDAGADPTIPNPETGLTALELARTAGHAAIVALLKGGSRPG